MGWKFRREMKILLDYMLADSPAVGVMGVFWKQPVELRPVVAGIEDAVALGLEAMVQQNGEAGAEADMAFEEQRLTLVLMEPERVKESAILVSGLYGVSEGQAAKAVRAWQKGEKFTLDVPHSRIGLPEFRALRMYEDVWFSGLVTDLQQAPAIYVREWLGRPELMQRIDSMGYEKAWVEKLVDGKFDGESGFANEQDDWRDSVGEKTGRTWTHDDRKRQWEVITAYYLGVDDAGQVGRWVVPFSAATKEFARKPELLKYEHGMYPFVAFAQETVSARLLDSRGVPELGVSDQQSMKLMSDSFEDHVQVSTLPPVKRMRGTVRRQIVMAPMGEIEETRPGEVEWMKGPEYPRANEAHMAEVRRRNAEYFGIPHESVPGPVTDVLNQDMVDDFLWTLADMVKMTIQLCQQFMPPEMVARVTGSKAMPWAGAPVEIQGQFDVQLAFDVASLDPEKYLGKSKILVEVVKALDSRAVVQWDKVVEAVLQGVDANLAERAITPAPVKSAQEADDEQGNIAKIGAGIEPPMPEAGLDFQARLATIQDAIQKNPEVVQKMSETSRKILDARVKYLEHQVGQQENAVIGRLGARPALG
jgi:hypothetical protein